MTEPAAETTTAGAKRKRIVGNVVKKACTQCRAAHRACNEDRPCKRCQKKNVSCIDDLSEQPLPVPTTSSTTLPSTPDFFHLSSPSIPSPSTPTVMAMAQPPSPSQPGLYPVPYYPMPEPFVQQLQALQLIVQEQQQHINRLQAAMYTPPPPTPYSPSVNNITYNSFTNTNNQINVRSNAAMNSLTNKVQDLDLLLSSMAGTNEGNAARSLWDLNEMVLIGCNEG